MVTNRIRTVTEVPGLGAQTPEAYRARQAQLLAGQRRTPGLSGLQAQVSNEPIPAYVSNGTWRIRCHCGEAPPTHPEWKLACCSGCGAIYESVVFPDDREAIEAVLVKRPDLRNRNWMPSETVAELLADNAEHGVTG